MVRWLRWHFPPDTGFEIRALAVWGRARYLSVTEAPHNTDFHTWMGKKHFCFFQTAETGNRTPAWKAALLTTTLGLLSNRGRSVVDYILTQQHFLSNCNDFTVHTVTDLIEQFNLQHYVSSSSKPTDHSVLWINLSLPGYSQRVDEPVKRDQPPESE